MYPSSKHILYLTYSIALSALWDNAYINKMLSSSSSFICSHSMITILHTGLGFFKIFFIQQIKRKKKVTVLDSMYENTGQRFFAGSDETNRLL